MGVVPSKTEYERRNERRIKYMAEERLTFERAIARMQEFEREHPDTVARWHLGDIERQRARARCKLSKRMFIKQIPKPYWKIPYQNLRTEGNK